MEILGEAAVAIEPSEGAPTNPAARQDFEPDGVCHAPSDFDAPTAELDEGVEEVLSLE